MTVDPRFERQLPDILDSLYLSGMPTYRDDLLQQVRRTPQRPAWSFLERWIPMADIASRPALAPRLPSRVVGMALIVLALLIALAVALVGTRQAKVPAPFGPAANGLITYQSAGDIYVGDPATGDARLIVGGPEHDSAPGYSPDGTEIAFIRSAGASQIDLYVVRPDGTGLRRVTTTPIAIDAWVNWAPDSRHLAMIQQVETTGCGTATCTINQLDMLDTTGSGTVRTILKADGMDGFTFRPPSGQEILYRARVDGKWGLFMINADGTNQRTVVPPTVPAGIDMSFASVAFSADGSLIFYNRGDQGGCCQLWVVNADGTDAHEFKPLGAAWDGQPVISPDGSRISYWHNPNGGPAHGITVVRTDGTGPVIETGPKLSGTASWAWSPDSSKILMYPNDVNGGSAYLLDPDGGAFTNVPWVSGSDIDWQRLAS